MPGSAEVASERLRDVLNAVASVSSDLTLEGLLDRILRQAGELVDAEQGFLDVLDRRSDRRIGTFAAFGIDGIVDAQHPGRQLLVDLLAHPDREPDPRAFIGVPIRIHDFLFGNLYLVDARHGDGFSPEDEEVVTAFAVAAGVVIENARLYEKGERQRLWLEAASEITTALLSPISRGTALQLVADRARGVAAADFVAVLMPVSDDALLVEAVSGVPADGVLGEAVDAGRSLLGEAVRQRATIVVPNTDLDPRYDRHKTPAWPDLGALMVLPLRSGAETGATVVGWFKGSQTDRWELDPVVPQAFVDQAALVLQMARAQADQALLAVFEDRDRIGRDLHDVVIQRLFGIGLTLDNTTRLVTSSVAVERMSSAIDDIDQTIKDIRRTIFALSSDASSDDLRSQLEEVLSSSTELLGFAPRVRLTGPVDSVIVGEVREQMLVVLRETMSNIVRHADATRVDVELDVDREVTLTVRDDGRGLGSPTAGNGLRNIRERAELLGGRCVVSSAPGTGTTVLWSVPRRLS